MSTVALEIATPTPVAAPGGLSNWFKTHRRLAIMLGVVLLTLVLAAGVLSYFLSYKPSNSGNAESQQQFALWMDFHGRSYNSDEKLAAAYQVWQDNLEKVQSNNLANIGVQYAMGPYADLSHEEFQAQILNLQRTASRSVIGAAVQTTATASAPTTLNWASNTAVVSPVKNQGQCGSCWAFTVAEAFEVAYNLAYKPSTSIQLSPQQITSCDPYDYGCNGGDPVVVYESYLGEGSGTYLTTEANYPYTSGTTGRTGSCNTGAAATGHVGLSTWNYAVNPTTSWSQAVENQLIQALQNGPVAICVDASPWQNYGGGVLSNSAGGCTGNQADVDHAVQLVGYTSTYWIVKNQWSTGWGDHGFIYLARGANTCCIFCEATQVTVTSV